jgi:hypothetical protein
MEGLAVVEVVAFEDGDDVDEGNKEDDDLRIRYLEVITRLSKEQVE